MQFDRNDIENLDLRFRVNLVNSAAGIKPANLIATVSGTGEENLAIFSSVSHLGSNPALLGFMLRPAGEVERHTMDNIAATGVYTINHIAKDFVENAHFTSAKFAKAQSEFAQCFLTPEYIAGYAAPFVKSSLIKIGMVFLESIPIRQNQTTLVIGQIEYLIVEDDRYVSTDGHIDLVEAESIGVSGLSHYFSLIDAANFPYARPDNLPLFKFRG